MSIGTNKRLKKLSTAKLPYGYEWINKLAEQSLSKIEKLEARLSDTFRKVTYSQNGETYEVSRQPYTLETTLKQMIEDGWSRGFQPEQTVAEAESMKFTVTKEKVLADWLVLTTKMENGMNFN